MGDVNLSGLNGYATGTTTSAYVTALTVKGYGGINGKTIFVITNLYDTSKTMYYKINGYYSGRPGAAAVAVTAETDVVNATPVVNTDADKPYDHIDVLVKYHSGAGTYAIDWMTY